MTIEERAHEFAYRNYDGFFTGREPAEESGYIAGATDMVQRAVEILKATGYFQDEEFREEVMIDQFVKAMKGE